MTKKIKKEEEKRLPQRELFFYVFLFHLYSLGKTLRTRDDDRTTFTSARSHMCYFNVRQRFFVIFRSKREEEIFLLLQLFVVFSSVEEIF